MSTAVSIIALIVILGLVIFIHEFGHYILAKKNGVGVVEFSIGMGPDIFSWRRNETKYAVKWIPFGGYCLMQGDQSYFPEAAAGEEAVQFDEEKSFSKKSVWVRISIILAGPVFNFLLALLLAIVLAALVGATTTKIGSVTPGYPAQEAGLQPGDEIVKLNGKRMHLFSEVSLYIALHEGEDIDVTYVRDGETYESTIVPVYDEEAGRYYIGISSSARKTDLNALEIVKYGYYEFAYDTGVVFKSLGMLFSGRASLNDLSGPVGMAGMVDDIVTEVTDDTKNESFWTTAYWVIINLMSFTVLISANLGIMNLLPIPAVDGGRLVFLILEAVCGKPVPKKWESIVTVAGFILLAILMVVVLFNDIRKIFF
ncbi:MAG: RIP metalloprotease RseP [Lachnospiraceae bacterium]|nr:RIP metalloprotease RseP [Lachnospiraceae bacterium]